MITKSEIELKFLEYRELLFVAKEKETDISLIKKYDSYIESLNEIEKAFFANDIALLANLIERESRSYGWSYLPNDYGEKAETAFWNLKKVLLKLGKIIK